VAARRRRRKGRSSGQRRGNWGGKGKKAELASILTRALVPYCSFGDGRKRKGARGMEKKRAGAIVPWGTKRKELGTDGGQTSSD